MGIEIQALIAVNSLLIILNTYMYRGMEKLADKLIDKLAEKEAGK